MQPARRVALDVIRAVNADDAYANLLLPARVRRAGLNTADAALATELTYGTLRRSGYYDRIIEMVAGRPVAKIDAPVRDVLRLAAHQLLSMRVAPHAAVHEAVQQVRSLGKSSASGFVNGVLRTITRTDREEWLHRVQGEAASEDDRLAVLHSHPVWIIEALRDALAAQGRESELTYLLDADNSPPRVGLVALPGLADRRTVSARLPNTEFSPIGLALAAGDPLDIAEVRAGTVRVQDEGSQLAALALSRARPVAAGERWLDLCAGPGGKTAVLAAEAAVHGATVLANEVAPARAQLVRNAIAAVPGGTKVLELDGRVVGARERRGVRPRADRCSVHRTRCAAPPPRVPLAQITRRCRPADPTPVRAARVGADGTAPRRRTGVRHLLAAPRRDPGHRRGGARRASRAATARHRPRPG